MDIPAMNAMLDLFRIRGQGAFSSTKFAVLVAGILLAGSLAWFVVPWIFNLIASTIPGLWTAVRSSTAPPYLFIAVNFIILAIWKLSENRALHADRLPEEESPFDTDIISPRTRDPVSSQNPKIFRKTSPEDFSKTPLIPAGNAMSSDSAGEVASPALASQSSCITTVSEVKSTASSSSDGLLAPESALTTICPERKEETTVVDEGDKTGSLDATWNSILKKSDRWERYPPPPPAAKRTVRESATAVRGNNAFSEVNDEMNQRFDDFIKKGRDQIRLRKPG